MGTSVIITRSKCISCILVLVIVFILWAKSEILMVAVCLSPENCCVISCLLLFDDFEVVSDDETIIEYCVVLHD